jgi:hypothetical protein
VEAFFRFKRGQGVADGLGGAEKNREFEWETISGEIASKLQEILNYAYICMMKVF